MLLVCMESYDKVLLGNIYFKASLGYSDLEIFGSKLEKTGKTWFLCGGQSLKFLEFCFPNFISSICVLTNFSEKEAKLLILEHIQYLGVFARKFWFLANMSSQNGS